MPPDFLSSREDAILVWAIVILGYVFYKDPRGIGSSSWRVVRALFVPKLLLLFGSAALYSMGIVLVGESIGIWHTTSLKETVYWFAGSAVVLIGGAVEATPGWAYVKKVLRKAVGLTIVVAFVVNFYVLSLGYELVLVFLVLVLTLGRAFASGSSIAPSTSSKTIDRALTGIGVLLLTTFVLRAIFEPGELVTRDTVERFLVVPVLTVGLIPYLLAVAWYCRREVANLRRRLGLSLP
jgi:hypothetical protein